MNYKISCLYHPSHRVPSLKDADTFFKDVFGVPSLWRSDIFTKPDPRYPSYPTDYCLFTPIADVFFDCIDPAKYIIDGEQRYTGISEPHLNGLGWGLEGIDVMYEKIHRLGIRCTDQANRPGDPARCPTASFKSSKLFYTVAEDSGVRYEFYPTASIGPYDHRKNPTWQLEPGTAKGPLGIQFCSHHTILTEHLDRALRLYVDVLGGTVIHREYNHVRGAECTYVKLADAVFEFGVPKAQDTYAMKDFNARQHKAEDVYHALTWKVGSLSAVETHLQEKAVKIMAKSDKLIVVDPQEGLGIPWGFAVDIVPNDTRYI